MRTIYGNQEIELSGYLIMDFDGTLIIGNSSLEELSSISSPKRVFGLIRLISRRRILARSAIKSAIADTTKDAPFSPTIDLQLLKILNEYAASGQKAFIVSAANIRTLKKFRHHLDPRVQLIGSSEFMNLKGKAKAQTIQNLLGYEDFTYFGDSVSDFPVFKISKKAYLVGNNGRTQRLAAKKEISVEVLMRLKS
jgi:phosphoserine phosphatase